MSLEENTEAQRPLLTGQDIGEAEGALTGLLEDVLAESENGVTRSEYIALRVLTARGPFTPATIHKFLVEARQLGLDRAGVDDLLATLEAKGYVSGAAPDGPGPVYLTENGAAEHAKIAAAVSTVTQQVFAGFDRDDLATAHSVLVQLVERAQQLRSNKL
jgi:DNA-binding MarR family transcriptional regulator